MSSQTTAQLSQDSVSAGNPLNVNHQATTYQAACALEADRKQGHSKDASTRSACGPRDGMDWLVKLMTQVISNRFHVTHRTVSLLYSFYKA